MPAGRTQTFNAQAPNDVRGLRTDLVNWLQSRPGIPTQQGQTFNMGSAPRMQVGVPSGVQAGQGNYGFFGAPMGGQQPGGPPPTAGPNPNGPLTGGPVGGPPPSNPAPGPYTPAPGGPTMTPNSGVLFGGTPSGTPTSGGASGGGVPWITTGPGAMGPGPSGLPPQGTVYQPGMPTGSTGSGPNVITGPLQQTPGGTPFIQSGSGTGGFGGGTPSTSPSYQQFMGLLSARNSQLTPQQVLTAIQQWQASNPNIPQAANNELAQTALAAQMAMRLGVPMSSVMNWPGYVDPAAGKPPGWSSVYGDPTLGGPNGPGDPGTFQSWLAGLPAGPWNNWGQMERQATTSQPWTDPNSIDPLTGLPRRPPGSGAPPLPGGSSGFTPGPLGQVGGMPATGSGLNPGATSAMMAPPGAPGGAPGVPLVNTQQNPQQPPVGAGTTGAGAPQIPGTSPPPVQAAPGTGPGGQSTYQPWTGGPPWQNPQAFQEWLFGPTGPMVTGGPLDPANNTESAGGPVGAPSGATFNQMFSTPSLIGGQSLDPYAAAMGGTPTQSVDQLGGANSAFFQNMMGQLAPAFAQRRAEGLAAAKESAGNLVGSGFANILGSSVNRSLGEEQAALANYATMGLQAELQRQMANQQVTQQNNQFNAQGFNQRNLDQSNFLQQANVFNATNANQMAAQNQQAFLQSLLGMSTGGVSAPQVGVQQGGGAAMGTFLASLPYFLSLI